MNTTVENAIDSVWCICSGTRWKEVVRATTSGVRSPQPYLNHDNGDCSRARISFDLEIVSCSQRTVRTVVSDQCEERTVALRKLRRNSDGRTLSYYNLVRSIYNLVCPICIYVCPTCIYVCFIYK